QDSYTDRDKRPSAGDKAQERSAFHPSENRVASAYTFESLLHVFSLRLARGEDSGNGDPLIEFDGFLALLGGDLVVRLNLRDKGFANFAIISRFDMVEEPESKTGYQEREEDGKKVCFKKSRFREWLCV